MVILILCLTYFAIGLIWYFRNRLRSPLFKIMAPPVLIVLLWPMSLYIELLKLWSADRFRVGFAVAAYDPEQPRRSEIPKYTFFASWAEAIVHAKELARGSDRKVTIRDEARFYKSLVSGYLPQYVTLAPAGEVIDASNSRIRQEYTNEAAWLNPVSESVSISTYKREVQAILEGDYTTAMRAFRSSANDGEPSAMYWLGVMYGKGKGVSVNHREAAQWFLKAAESGHSEAQFGLGCMYQTGTGVATNRHETIRWWRKSAEQGNSEAQHYLGMMAAQGEGVRQNHFEGMQWLERAAEHLESQAMPDVSESMSAPTFSEPPSPPMLHSNYIVHHFATIGTLALAAFLGVVHVVIHRTLWHFTGVNHVLGWLMRKAPPETQPMAAFLIGRIAAFAGLLFIASMIADGWINWLAGGLAILVAIWTLGFIFRRYRSAWRRLYFGFMDLYSGFAAMHEVGEAMTHGSMPFDQIMPLTASLRKALPDLTNNEAEDRIVRWKKAVDNREITELLRNVYRKLHPSANELETNQAVDDIINEMLSAEHYPSYLLRYVIGKIIEYKAGPSQMEAYWQAVMTRKVT